MQCPEGQPDEQALDHCTWFWWAAAVRLNDCQDIIGAFDSENYAVL